jgi:hypothetical protein
MIFHLACKQQNQDIQKNIQTQLQEELTDYIFYMEENICQNWISDVRLKPHSFAKSFDDNKDFQKFCDVKSFHWSFYVI